RYEIREYPLPDPAPGCAVVRMALSGICGTDKHTYQGYTTQYAGTESAKEIPFPIIQGHENVGTLAALGPVPGGRPSTDFDGQPLHVGDRVVVGANVVCGQCYYCRHAFPYFAFDDTGVGMGVCPLVMCFLMKARMLGAGTIVAIDLSPYRLAMARQLGADHALDARTATARERQDLVRGLTHGRGADVVVECAGV